MPKLSVLITCKDEALHIADCITSVRGIADEIVVADSGSTDATLAIVRAAGGCRVIEREFISYADFKNWAIPQCSHPWILIIDADERVTPQLAEEVRTLLKTDPEQDAFRIRRENYFLGHRVRFSGWNNDRVVRLIRRDVCRYFPRPVHEAMNVPTGKIAKLRHAMSHYTAWDIEHFCAKQNDYSTRGAVHLHAEGKRVGLGYTFLHAPLRFVQMYLFRGGIFDGYPGLMVCGITAYYTFLKDIKLWGLNNTLNPPAGFVRRKFTADKSATVRANAA
jgi:glycosyltransferase involved in cell wall biosynthesis